MKEIQVIRSNRRTAAIQIYPDLSVVLRVPYRISDQEIKKILTEKEAWIRKHTERIKKQKAEHGTGSEIILTDTRIRELAEQASQYIPQRVRYFAPLVGVDYGRITIRNQKTRWGSCSSKGNLNFNCLLMLVPPEVIDYVVVHELCHRKEMNHSKAFWEEVRKVLPDYMISKRWLKDNGYVIMRGRK